MGDDATGFHGENDPVGDVHLPPDKATPREPRVIVVVLVPFAGEEAVDELIHGLALFFISGQSAVSAVIEIAHDEGEEENAGHPGTDTPPTRQRPGDGVPKQKCEEDAREKMPELFDGTGALILREGMVGKTNVTEAFGEAFVFGGGEIEIHFLHCLGGEIASEPAEMRTIGIAGFIGFGMMDTMRDDVTFLTEKQRVGPQKQAREPEAAEFEGLMGTIPVIPDGVVNHANETAEEHDGDDGGDGKVRGQKPRKDREGREVKERVGGGEQSGAFLEKVERVEPFD